VLNAKSGSKNATATAPTFAGGGGGVTSAPLTPQPVAQNPPPVVNAPIPPTRTASTAPSEAAWRSAADRWIGVPYQMGGETRSGVDCSAFTRAIYREVTGIELPRTTYDQFQSGDPADYLGVRAGDLVFFLPQPGQEGVPHVGVMVDRREFAHAGTRGGVAYAFLEQRMWRERITGIRRIIPFP